MASNAVIIQYKRSSSEGIVNVEVEKYPAGESLYGYQRVFQSIDLDPGGSGSVSGTTIEMVTSLIYTSQQWWWEKKCPQINTTYNKFIEVSELGVPDPADTTSYYDYKDAPPLTWKNELIGGSVPPSSNFTAKKQVFRAKCRLKVYSSKSHTDDTLLFNGFIHIATNELSVVNGGSGTGSNYYTAGNVSSGDLAEPTPVGLPRAYYEATHTPQWDGQITITEREVSSDFAGNVINISGGRGEWESMNAVPQSVDLDADNGVTSLSVGLANHLRIEDMVELQKQSRNRTTFYSYERVTGGSSGSQASITAPPLNNMGGYTPFNLNQRTIELES